MKKRLRLLITSALLISSIWTTSAVAAPAKDNSLKIVEFTKEERQAHYGQILKEASLKYDSTKQIQNTGSSNTKNAQLNDSFYKEYLYDYIPNYSYEDPEAFPLIKIHFDNRYNNYEKGIEINYTTGQALTWQNTFNINGSIEFAMPIIKNALKLQAGYTLAYTSSTNSAIGTKATVTNLELRRGYIPVFAPGVVTGGAFIYKWYDVVGNSGYRTEPDGGSGILPFEEYKYGGIKFGLPVYN